MRKEEREGHGVRNMSQSLLLGRGEFNQLKQMVSRQKIEFQTQNRFQTKAPTHRVYKLSAEEQSYSSILFHFKKVICFFDINSRSKILYANFEFGSSHIYLQKDFLVFR